MLTLTLSPSSSSRSGLVLPGEPPPPPHLPPPCPRLVLALVLVLLSPEPLLPLGEPPRRKRGWAQAATGSGGKEPDEDETERGWRRAGCIVLQGLASCSRPPAPGRRGRPRADRPAAASSQLLESYLFGQQRDLAWSGLAGSLGGYRLKALRRRRRRWVLRSGEARHRGKGADCGETRTGFKRGE